MTGKTRIISPTLSKTANCRETKTGRELLLTSGIVLTSLFYALVGSSSTYAAVAPEGIQRGSLTLYPKLSLEQVFDSNLLRQNSDPQESHITVISPGISGHIKQSHSDYNLNYRLRSGFHSTGDEDDYLDQFLSGKAKWQINHRNQLRLSGGLNSTHEPRGTGVSDGIRAFEFDEVVTYRQGNIKAGYTLGSQESEGRLKFGLGWTDKTYTNFRSLTKPRDRDTYSANAAFHWVPGKTGLVFDLSHELVDYENDPVSVDGSNDTSDSQLTKALAGITWRLTGKTKGSVKLGHALKTFEDKDRDEFSGFSWDAKVDWRPLPHALLSLKIGRIDQESDGRGDFIDNQNIEVNWHHDWSEKIDSFIGIIWGNHEYVNDPEEREDESIRTYFTVDYSIRQWLILGLQGEHFDKNSNLSEFDYSRHFVGLKITTQL